VTDGAQAPNEMAAAKVQVVVPEWPSNRTGVSYLWKNARERNMIFDEQIGLPITSALGTAEYWAAARFNRDGAAMAAGDTVFVPFPDEAAGARLSEACKKSNQFSLEIVVATADLAQTKISDGRDLPIFQWANGLDWGIFWLFQEKDKLQVRLSKQGVDGNPAVFEMATLTDTKPHHLIVSYAPKRLAFYLDGKKVKEIDPLLSALLDHNWAKLGEDNTMYFAGGHYHTARNKIAWRGTFEHVAMYSRFIEEPEAAKNAAVVVAELAKRKTLPRIEVQAKLVAKSKIPDPREIAPYRNVLMVNEYQVEQVLKGTYAGKTIRVAQWGMLDLKPTPLAAQEPGTSVKLVLETFVDHDELVPELISDTLKEDFNLKLYTDVNL
jgi:hypothetical protein